MRALLLAVTCGVLAGCPPRPPLQPCNPEACTDPGKSCKNIDGVNLCVYTCSETVVCYPDEFALDVDGTCACVPRAPAGRTCTADAHCGLAPDTTAEPGDTQYLCAGPEGGRMCMPLGTACRPGTAATPAQGCTATQVCDPSTRLCTACGGAELACNDQDDDCDPATPDALASELACNDLDDDCKPETPDSAAEVCGNGVDEDCDGSDKPCGAMTLRLTGGGVGRLRVRRMSPAPAADVCNVAGAGVCDLETNLVALGADQGAFELTLWPLPPGAKVTATVDGAIVAEYKSRTFTRWRLPVKIDFTVDRAARTLSSNQACPSMVTCTP